MSTRRQAVKDRQNKQSQAREQYGKNKTLLKETTVKRKEKESGYIPPEKAGTFEQQTDQEIAREKPI